jgi:hypothetical protein
LALRRNGTTSARRNTRRLLPFATDGDGQAVVGRVVIAGPCVASTPSGRRLRLSPELLGWGGLARRVSAKLGDVVSACR